jgi:hypothetical protein
MKLAVAFLTCILAASAAGVDGQWNAELSARGKKAAAAQAPAAAFTLSLKSQENGQVTGTVMIAGKKKARPQIIQNAKLNGNKLTFTTVQTGKNGTNTFSWQITVEGDQMTGTRAREGAKRGVPFKARRS